MILSPIRVINAAESYSELFISVGDAIMKVKADDWEAVDELVTQLNDDWVQVEKSGSKEAQNVEKALLQTNQMIKNQDKDKMLDALSGLSLALVEFEKEQNPVDKDQQREEIQEALLPILTKLQVAINQQNADETFAQYEKFFSAWSKKEGIVREQSIPYYGKIETQMGFLRIALTQDKKDFNQIQSIYDALSTAVKDFASGKQLQNENNDYSLQTLVDLLGNVNQAIESNQPKEAVSYLQEFLTVWPLVEGDVRTRNGSLYSQLESEIPVIAGKLSSMNVDLEDNQRKIQEYMKAIQLLQGKSNYTLWDVALIMLREGLEALLIVSALIAFLRKANVPQQQKWIWLGAISGVIMSIVAAIFINVMFTSATAGANREKIEGFTGIAAVVMMVGVGVWLHQKSNMSTWNRYIKKKMDTALSTGSIISLAFVSFLSVFREGAETIIFYIGMAPSVSTAKLLAGIALAVVILCLFAFLFIRYSTKIAVTPFFKVATFLIYFLAFKILGVSIHALQLTGNIGMTQIDHMPIMNWLGLYPTWETIIPQLIILLIFLLTSLGNRQRVKLDRAKTA